MTIPKRQEELVPSRSKKSRAYFALVLVLAFTMILVVCLPLVFQDRSSVPRQSLSDLVPHHHDKPGIQVINAILENMWPSMGKDILSNIRTNPVLIDPYLLELNGGRLRYPPKIRNIKLLPNDCSPEAPTNASTIDEAPLVPPRFECEIEYKGRPDLDFCLTGADKHNHNKLAGLFKKVMRRLVPDIYIEIKSIDLHARLEVELDMHNKKVTFFFLERPRIEWDLEFSFTKAEIPFIGEDQLDTVLTNVMASINRDRAIHVSF